tara:strand:+ start:400 stop:564 length:165 start_codon:yes stop_codon:yes gene_type:complete
MIIRGFMMGKYLSLILLMTTLGLFTVLPISQTHDVTLGESIFGRLENLLEKREK